MNKSKDVFQIMIISDSHGNIDFVEQFLKKIRHEQVDLIYHLGDYYDDADAIIKKGYPCVRVPGTWTSYYQDYRFENRRIEEINNWRIYLTHTPTKHYNDLPDDTDPQEIISQNMADIICHGHTHVWQVKEENNVVIINPGHIKSANDNGKPPTFAKLKILNNQYVEIEIVELLTKTVLYKKKFKKI